MLGCFVDYVQTEVSLSRDNRLVQIAEKNKMELSEYMDLYSPAVEWILQCLSHRAEEAALRAVLKKYQELNNAMLLSHILTSFEPSFISQNALALAVLIRETDASVYPKYKLYATLGMNLVLSAPPPGTCRSRSLSLSLALSLAPLPLLTNDSLHDS